MQELPPIHRASFVDGGLLLRSTPRQSTASEQAKRMMGPGNLMAGKDIRANASVQCSKCGRWHRPGTVCPRMVKAHDVDVLLHQGLEKGVVKTKPKSGNPYHDSRTGKFTSAGGGSGPKAASSGWTASPDGSYSAMGGRAKLRKDGKKWKLELDGETHTLPKKATFTHAEKIIQDQAQKKVADLSAQLGKLKAQAAKQGQAVKEREAKQAEKKAPYDTAGLEGHYAKDEIMRQAYREAKEHGATESQAQQWAMSQADPNLFNPPKNFSVPGRESGAKKPEAKPAEKKEPALQSGDIFAGGRQFREGSPEHKAYTETRSQGGTVGEGLTAANKVERQGSSAADDIFVGQQHFIAGTPEHTKYQEERGKGASSGYAAKEAQAAKPDLPGGEPLDIAHLLGGGAQDKPKQAQDQPATAQSPKEIMEQQYAQALAGGASPKQAEQWALSQGYPHLFDAPKGYSGPGESAGTGPRLHLDPSLATAGMQQGQAMGAGLAQPGGTMPTTVNLAQQGTTNLLNQPSAPKQPTASEQQQQLEDSSQQLQDQQRGYLQRLRDWMSRYVR